MLGPQIASAALRLTRNTNEMGNLRDHPAYRIHIFEDGTASYLVQSKTYENRSLCSGTANRAFDLLDENFG
jgi:hypothetical protein